MGRSCITDEEVARLHSKFLDGDDGAGWELVRSQEGLITSLVHKLSGKDRHLFDDIMSEFKVLLFGSLKKSYVPSKSRITTFTTVVFQRRGMRIKKKLTRPDGTEYFDDTTKEGSYREEFSEDLASIIDNCTYSQKMALTMLAHGKSIEQIDETLANQDVTDVSASELLQSAISQIREENRVDAVEIDVSKLDHPVQPAFLSDPSRERIVNFIIANIDRDIDQIRKKLFRRGIPIERSDLKLTYGVLQRAIEKGLANTDVLCAGIVSLDPARQRELETDRHILGAVKKEPWARDVRIARQLNLSAKRVQEAFARHGITDADSRVAFAAERQRQAE